jgi:hypothetical protein
MQADGFDEDDVGGLRDEVGAPVPVRAGPRVGQAARELSRVTAQDDHVTNGKEVRQVAHDDVRRRDASRPPGSGGRGDVHYPAPNPATPGAESLGQFGDLEGPPGRPEPSGYRCLPGAGSAGERHRSHVVPGEGRE